MDGVKIIPHLFGKKKKKTFFTGNIFIACL